jgi:DNA polymerase III subunit gamma/tau
VWDIRYRPACFSDVLGQTGATEVLKARLAKGTAFDTSYIFSGGHGQGKTTLARILSRAMLCQNRTADQEPCNACEACKDALNEESAAISERDAASQGTIDHAREIVKSLNFVVEGASKRIFIFDEAHRMSRDAQDVFLKPIEDKRMVGIFCTTEPDKIRGPIRSRCEAYQLRRTTREDILARMKWVLAQENVEYEDDAVLTVIDHAGGHVRDILNQSEMIAQLGPITLQAVREHLNLSLVSTYYEILLALGTPATSVRLAEEACERAGSDEVAEGLAEAAMSSYRLAHGMFAEFTYVDRNLATKVHALYGDSVIKFSEYFLRSYRMSKTALLSDIIACSSGVPAQTVSAPTIIQVMAPAQAVQPVPVPAVQIPKGPTVSPSTPPSPATMTPPPVPTEIKSPNGIGNKGSGDVCALTSIDDRGVAPERPRGERAKRAPVPHGAREEFLTPEEFRMKLIIRCSAMSGGGEA